MPLDKITVANLGAIFNKHGKFTFVQRSSRQRLYKAFEEQAIEVQNRILEDAQKTIQEGQTKYSRRRRENHINGTQSQIDGVHDIESGPDTTGKVFQ